MDRYDADQAPDRAAWLALDPQERLALIRRHHRGRIERTLHAAGYDRALHAALHQVIETQIASNEPPITGETVSRLCGEGLRRHAAVHAVGEALLRLVATGTESAPEDWERQLRALSAGDWLGDRMRRELGAPE